MKKNAENTTTVTVAAATAENEVEVIATTKTVNPLSALEIIKDEKVIESLPITCPGQMWRELKGCALFNKFGADVKIRAIRDTGEAYMEFTQGTRKDGTPYMKQNIVKNRRAQVMKQNAARIAEEKAREEKNAKARARRAAKKNPQIVPAPESVKETPAEVKPAAEA